MTYKNIKFEDSPVMRSLEKLAVNKGLVKPEIIAKTAAVKTSALKPTENFEENILKLCSALRSRGFDKYATEVETNFFNLKRAQAYDVHKETGEDLVNAAHPDGSHQMKGVAGDALVETTIDTQKAIQKMVAKQPTGKQAAVKNLVGIIKESSKFDKKSAINAIKIVLAEPINTSFGKDVITPSVDISENTPDKAANAYFISTFAARCNFLLYQETLMKMEKDILPLMAHDKIPAGVKTGVNTYYQFIKNIHLALVTALSSAWKKAKELEDVRLKASNGDKSAALVNITEIKPMLTAGKAANFGLGAAEDFGQLKTKIQDIYTGVADALQNKLLPAFDQPPFDGELKNMAAKIKESLNSSIDTLKKG